MTIVTLITDLGTRDGYVGEMKGVLLARCPGVMIVDVTHDIDPGDVEGAAWARSASPSTEGICSRPPPRGWRAAATPEP